VQVAPAAKPVIVVLKGEASLAEPLLGEGVPLVHETLTGTDAPEFGTKSLFTVSVALFRVFVIVQLDPPPMESATLAQFPWLAVYPVGNVSVVVQVAPAEKPVIVVLNGVASEAVPLEGEGVPLVQVTFTGTLAPEFGTKSLFTVSVALFSVLVIVQFDVPPTLIATLTQFAWLAV
jgi:hypothetical protein